MSPGRRSARSRATTRPRQQDRTEQVRLDDAAMVVVAHLVDRARQRGARRCSPGRRSGRPASCTAAQNASIDCGSVTSSAMHERRAARVGDELGGLLELLDAARAERRPSTRARRARPRSPGRSPPTRRVTTATRDAGSGTEEFTAVDVERLAGDDPRPRRDEEHDAVRDVVLRRDDAAAGCGPRSRRARRRA